MRVPVETGTRKLLGRGAILVKTPVPPPPDFILINLVADKAPNAGQGPSEREERHQEPHCGKRHNGDIKHIDHKTPPLHNIH